LKEATMQSSNRSKPLIRSVLKFTRTASGRANQKNKTKPKSHPQLSHPDNTPEETERLLDELERHQAAD
jgi:hypothetical protein